MPDMNEKLLELVGNLIKAAGELSRYRDHVSPCDYEQCDICTCGMIAANNGLLKAMADAKAELSTASPEPLGSVVGDEYDVAAREWLFGVDVENDTFQKEKNAEAGRLAAHFRAACGSRESELETALRELMAKMRRQAVESHIEADRIRRTVFVSTEAEANCYIRAEVWDMDADAIDALLSAAKRLLGNTKP